MQETQETGAPSLGWEIPLEKEMATWSSILAWEILWTEEPGGLQAMDTQSIEHDWEQGTGRIVNLDRVNRWELSFYYVTRCFVCLPWKWAALLSGFWMSLPMRGENGWETRKYKGGSSFYWIPRGVAPAVCTLSRSQLLSAFKSQKPPQTSPRPGPCWYSQGPAIASVIPLHPAHKF